MATMTLRGIDEKTAEALKERAQGVPGTPYLIRIDVEPLNI